MSTVKADSLQPTIAGNNLILKTGSGDVERIRIAPTGAMTVSSTVDSTFGGSLTVNGVSTLKGKLGLGAAYSGTPVPDLDIVTSNNGSLLDPQLNTFTTTRSRAGAAFGNASTFTKLFVGNSSSDVVWMQVQNSDNSAYDLSLQPVGGGVAIGATQASAPLHVYGSSRSRQAEIRLTDETVSSADWGILAQTNNTTKMFRIIDRKFFGGGGVGSYCDRFTISELGHFVVGLTSGMTPQTYTNYSGSNDFSTVFSIVGKDTSGTIKVADGRLELQNAIPSVSVDTSTTFGRVMFVNSGQAGTNALKAQIDCGSEGTGANKGGNMYFSTNPGGSSSSGITQRMVLTSAGLLGIANPSPTVTLDVTGSAKIASTENANKLIIEGYGNTRGYGIFCTPWTNTNAYAAIFNNAAGTQVGFIQTSVSATTYSTSSDYRLKSDPVELTGALARVQALKPSSYTWKADGTAGEGFIAHELAEIVPLAVSGEKDAVDENGKMLPQGVDLSKVVPVLTAAIKELKAIVDAQAVEIAELKAK